MKTYKIKLSHSEFGTSPESSIINRDPCVFLTLFVNRGILGADVNGFSSGCRLNLNALNSPITDSLFYAQFLRHFGNDVLSEILANFPLIMSGVPGLKIK